jgi:hypothetical protein
MKIGIQVFRGDILDTGFRRYGEVGFPPGVMLEATKGGRSIRGGGGPTCFSAPFGKGGLRGICPARMT